MVPKGKSRIMALQRWFKDIYAVSRKKAPDAIWPKVEKQPLKCFMIAYVFQARKRPSVTQVLGKIFANNFFLYHPDNVRNSFSQKTFIYFFLKKKNAFLALDRVFRHDLSLRLRRNIHNWRALFAWGDLFDSFWYLRTVIYKCSSICHIYFDTIAFVTITKTHVNRTTVNPRWHVIEGTSENLRFNEVYMHMNLLLNDGEGCKMQFFTCYRIFGQ